MKLQLFSAVFLLVLSLISAIPITDSERTKQLAAEYARLHPNTGTAEPECEELTAEGQNELNADIDANKWPNNVLHYMIQTDEFTSEQIDLINAGIADLQSLTSIDGTPCVTLLERAHEHDYVSVENYSGCSSYIGRIGGRQRLSLVDGCVVRHGTIMHEFIHALGFHHEQKRTDRDDWVTINWDNIEPGKEGNFRKMDETEIDLLGTSYDYGSVMHYGAYGFAIDDSVPTIIPHDPDAEIGQRITLSQLDIERIQIHYGCLKAADSVHFKHLAANKLA